MSEVDYLSMIKDFLSQNNINLGDKSLEQFLGEISNLQSQPGGGYLQIGDFQIVKAPTGELSIVDNRTQAEGQPHGSEQLDLSVDQGQQSSQPQDQPLDQQPQQTQQPEASTDQPITEAQNGQNEDDDKPSKKDKKKKGRKGDESSDSDAKSGSSRSQSHSPSPKKKKKKKKEEA